MGGYAIKRQPNTATAIANGDSLRLYDTSAGDERQITVGNLLRKVGTLIEFGDTTADVTGCNSITATAAGGSIVLGGLSGGVAGQILHIVKIVVTNNLTLTHGGAGTQPFICHGAADAVLTGTAGGYTLYCDGTSWIELNQA